MLQTIKTTLGEKKPLAKDVWFFKFFIKSTDVFSYIPGQYLMVNIKKDDGTSVNRAYSIANFAEDKKSFELIIHFLPGGVATKYFEKLQINDALDFRGPAGVFQIKNLDKNIIFLVTGTGIAPTLAMLSSLLKNLPNYRQKKIVSLFWGIQSKEDLFYYEELKALSLKYPNFGFRICFSKEDPALLKKDGFFANGRINIVYQSYFTMLNFQLFDHYLCGARDVVESLRAFLFSLGLSQDQVFFERF